MKPLFEYLTESRSSLVFDLRNENVADEIDDAAQKNGTIVSVDADKKLIKSKRIYICNQEGNTAVWLNDMKSIGGPQIYLIPNKEWKFMTSDVIIAHGKPIDGSLINLEGSPKLKRVNLMRDPGSDTMEYLKGCFIETFVVELSMVKPGFESLLNNLDIKRIEYICFRGTTFNEKTSFRCDELAIRGCKDMKNILGSGSSKKSDEVTTSNCPCIPELTTILSNNPSLKVIINWQSGGPYAQAKLENGEIIFNQLHTDNLNMAFKKCR